MVAFDLAVLDAITVTTCVASSSTHEMLRFSLGLVGLYDRFEGRVFSAEDVVNGKPAPDLFLHAAACIGVDPSRCATVRLENLPAWQRGCRSLDLLPE